MLQNNRKTCSALVLASFVLLLIAAPGFAQSTKGKRTTTAPQILGAENQSKQMNMTLWLNQRDKAGFDKLVKSMYDKNSPNFHHWLTLKEYGARFAPTAGDMAVVKQHLAAHNLKVVAADKMNR